MGTSGIVTGRMTFSMPYSDYLPRIPDPASKVTLTLRSQETDDEIVTEWYVDGRTIDGDKVNFVCYDRMAFADDLKADFEFAEGTEYVLISDLIRLTAQKMSLSGVENFSADGLGIKFPVTSIETRSCADILNDLSQIMCCYFCISNAGKLRAVGVGGSDLLGFSTNDNTEVKNVVPYTINCCELTDSAGKVRSAGTSTSGTDTIQNSCGNISRDELFLQAQSQLNRKYVSWKVEKASVGKIIELGSSARLGGYSGNENLIVNNVTMKINSCGIFASMGADALSGGEIGKYMGSLTRLAESAVKSGDKLGKHMVVTRYQGIIWVDDDEEE